jgi:S1-C subfamily serine protease
MDGQPVAPRAAAMGPELEYLPPITPEKPVSDKSAIKGPPTPKQAAPEILYGACIHFTTHYVNPQMLRPWKMGDPHTCTGTGFFIGDRRILTNSHVVHNHTSIRLERHGQPGNFAGRLLCESEVCDLALLTVDDDDFWTGLPSVIFQDAVPELDDTVLAVGYPLGSLTVTVTRGVVSAVKLMDLSLTRMSPEQLTVQIDAAINPGNSGGPVFNNHSKEVVGVAFSSNTKSAEGTGFIIPVPVIRLFLTTFETTKNPQFGLLPELGVRYCPLYNRAMRRHCFGSELKSPDDRNGVLVSAVDPHGCAAPHIKVDDILLNIDGQAISEKGDVSFRDQERLPWTYLVTRKLRGELISAEILRRSESGVERLECKLELQPPPRLLPLFPNVDYFPSYVMVGGLVLLPCGRPLADKAREQKIHSISNLHWFLEKHGKLEEVGHQAIVLCDVLAHPVNVSYDLRGERLLCVNGVAVKNMRHLVELLHPSKLEASTRETLELDFGFDERREERRQFVVFETKEILATTSEILRQNKIPQWCSPDLLPPGSS